MRFVRWTYLVFLAVLVVAPVRAHADALTDVWNINVGCPNGGFPFKGSFTGTAGSPVTFSSSGQCKRIPTNFTEFTFNTYSGATLNSNVVYGLHTGDVLVMPQLRTGDVEPSFNVVTDCPAIDKLLNFIFVQYGPDPYILENSIVSGTANYTAAGGILVTSRFNVSGGLISEMNMTLGGVCSNGIINVTGSGDLGGVIYLTKLGGGTYKTNANHAVFFLPSYTIDAPLHFGNRIYAGMMFDSLSSTETRQMRATSNANGDVFTLRAYSDVVTGTLDSSFEDTITLAYINHPRPGMMTGTVTRTGTGAGTEKISCIAYRSTSMRLICSGSSPANPSHPYTVSLAMDGVMVYGQETTMSNRTMERGIQGAYGVFSDGQKVFVADALNHRVTIWESIPTKNHVAPDSVVGQSTLRSNSSAITATGMNNPTGLHFDGTRLFVADSFNNRVLIWNQYPSVEGQAADVVLGQSNFTTNTANAGGIGAGTLNRPTAVYSTGTKLFVTDSLNHRVLVWNTIPASNKANATYVLGQANFTTATSNAGGRTAQSISGPYGVGGYSNNLYVADTSNHRILMWTTAITATRQPANLVLGQANMTTGTSNAGGISAQSISSPNSVWSDGTNMWVADSGNHRVLQWNAVPTSNRKAADLALGQPNFTSNTQNNGGVSGARMWSPSAAVGVGSKLYVSEYQGTRVLIWNSYPTATGQSADLVLGQSLLNTNTANFGGLDGTSLSGVSFVHSDGQRMFVSDTYNYRILGFNSIPTDSRQDPDFVLGQPNLTTAQINLGAPSPFNPTNQSLAAPYTVHNDGTRLIAADLDNSRILIWNTLPSTTLKAADIVLGQPNFTSRLLNNGGRSASSMSTPNAAFPVGTKLYVSDYGNNRVLIYNNMPTATFQAANLVLGQSNMTSGTANAGGISAGTLNGASSIASDGTRIWISDFNNNRVLQWNTAITGNKQNADIVLGQPNFTSSTANNGGISASRLYNPSYVHWDGSRLYVADYQNSRVLIYTSVPTVNGQAANAVLGQPNFTSNTPNNGGLTAYTMNFPTSVFSDGKNVFVGDGINKRLMIFEVF